MFLVMFLKMPYRLLTFVKSVICTHSLTDKTADSGSADGGSIPLGYASIIILKTKEGRIL